MHHDLIRILRIIASITLTPIITDCISEDISILVKRRRGDGAANCRIALESVFCYSVPEMECAV
jgi:rRNA-processing protein FCF1